WSSSGARPAAPAPPAAEPLAGRTLAPRSGPLPARLRKGKRNSASSPTPPQLDRRQSDITTPIVVSVRELQCGHSGNDQDDAEVAAEAAGVAEQPDPHQERAGGADPGPYGISRAEGDLLLCQKQERAADRHRNDRQQHADNRLSRLLGPFEPDRPADF